MPRFLLLPGLDGTGDLLRDFAAQLEVLGPVEVLCYPGAGAQDYATLLRGLQARVRIDADCVILAESFAGPLGMALAAQAAVVPRALVLCATFAASPQPWLRPLAPLLGWLPLQAARLGQSVAQPGNLDHARSFAAAGRGLASAAAACIAPASAQRAAG